MYSIRCDSENHGALTDADRIVSLENLAYNAWTARDVERYGHWFLRADEGVTRRANSVFPFGAPPTSHLQDAVEHCISFYKKRDILPRFQVTSASKPDGLDKSLEDLGFAFEMRTYMQTAPIDRLLHFEPIINVEILVEPEPIWIHTYAKAGGFGKHSMKIREGIFRRTALDKAFALARTDEDGMGAGLGVLEGDWLGLFGIETIPGHRRKGVATAVNHALASWGAQRGARRAYLQVEASNDSALRLYSKMGFETEYHYWYRTLGLDTANDSP